MCRSFIYQFFPVLVTVPDVFVEMQSLIDLMQVKLIFTRKVFHLTWFWKWEFLELRNGLFEWFVNLHCKLFFKTFLARDISPLSI